MNFFVGMDDVCNTRHIERTFVSVNRLLTRKSDFPPQTWIMDSGAFTEISKHGRWTRTVHEYAVQIERWKTCGNMLAAVSMDWMCEPFITAKTGFDVVWHQEFTCRNYEALRDATGCYVMPVLQGFQPFEYVNHIRRYGDLLKEGAWVGVGSVCRRNVQPQTIRYILEKIKSERPDIRLHAFGLKLTSLLNRPIRALLETADSMAWSFAARKQGRKAHDWQEAKRFYDRINGAEFAEEPETFSLTP